MWGYDSPVRFDMVQVQEAKRPSRFDQIEAAIMRVVEEAPPAQRALRARLEQLDPEKALELLNAGTSDCTSALPAPDGERAKSIT
jgi:hypothetical protein